MATEVINIKIDSKLKADANTVIAELGLTMSSLIKVLLKDLVRTRSLNISAGDELSEYAIESIEQSRLDIKNGSVSPAFTNAKEATAWLKNNKEKYL